MGVEKEVFQGSVIEVTVDAVDWFPEGDTVKKNDDESRKEEDNGLVEIERGVHIENKGSGHQGKHDDQHE